MKRLIYILLACFCLTACEVEISHNGALDGNWQLRQMDTLSTGGTTDMSHSYIYWAFDTHLLQVRDIDDNLKIFFRFQRESDQLTLLSPYRVVTKDQLVAIDNTELLQPFGIMNVEDVFQIEQLNHQTFTIKNQYYRMHFRKY